MRFLVLKANKVLFGCLPNWSSLVPLITENVRFIRLRDQGYAVLCFEDFIYVFETKCVDLGLRAVQEMKSYTGEWSEFKPSKSTLDLDFGNLCVAVSHKGVWYAKKDNKTLREPNSSLSKITSQLN